MKITRIIPAVLSATTATFSLFYLMQAMVAHDEVAPALTPEHIWVDYVQVDEPITPEAKDRLERPEPIAQPDPVEPPEITEIADGYPIDPPPGPTVPPFGPEPVLNLGLTDGERMPIVRVAPQFPRRCAERGLSGWVVLEFDVSALGAVENPVVIGNDGSGCFDRAALKTISKFKYKPTVVDGQPKRSTQVRFRMSFNLEA